MTYYPAPVLARPNLVGVSVAFGGGVLALLGTAVNWYSPGSVSLQDIVSILDLPGAKTLPKAYFGWALWVVLALTVICSMLGNVPGPLSTPGRIAGPLLGAGGAALVCASLSALIEGHSIFDHADAGLWFVLAGFLVAGAAGAFGPRRGR